MENADRLGWIINESIIFKQNGTSRNYKFLKEVNIPWKIVASSQNIRKEIHGFCDISEQAYRTCIYMRRINTDGTIMHLIIQISCCTGQDISLELYGA